MMRQTMKREDKKQERKQDRKHGRVKFRTQGVYKLVNTAASQGAAAAGLS